ncbi:hypothetical protein AO390_16780 [Pseudomonas marginalis ICMP 11289]|nr:hypothetical protein AO390_16780 [Pseudomonas marginalis ICMP 11289]
MTDFLDFEACLNEGSPNVLSEQLQQQIAALRQDAKALIEAAAKSSEREVEIRLLLTSAQAENQQLRRERAIESELAESHVAAAPASPLSKSSVNSSRAPRK